MQGETKTFLLLVKVLATKVPQNLDLVKIYFTVKERVDDIAPFILKRTVDAGGAVGEIVIATPQATAANTGRATITLTSDDTKLFRPGVAYWFDVWVVLPTGEERPVIRRRQIAVDTRITIIP
jgi:hypothetical protein